MFRIAGLAILFLTAGSQIAQADFTQEVRRCDSEGTHPDIRIVACTRNIQSGRFAGPNLAVAFMNRGLAYKKKSQWDRAMADYGKALHFDPGNAQVFADRGLAYEKKGEPSQALLDFEKAHALGFRHPLLLKKLREAGTVL